MFQLGDWNDVDLRLCLMTRRAATYAIDYPMRRLLPILCLLIFASPAAADLYTVVGKDGVITITNKKRRGAKVLYRTRSGKSKKAKRSKTRSAKAKGPTLADARARALRYEDIVNAASQYYGLPVALIWAVMRVESHFKPRALSNRGAQGLMQLMPGTAGDMGVKDPWDPEQNIFGGSRYLRILANKFDGDLVLTLSGYHAGGGAVDSVGGIPYEQTAEYVRRVLNAYYRYQKQLPTKAP